MRAKTGLPVLMGVLITQASCSGEGSGGGDNAPSATVTISLTALAPIENVQDLTLEFTPVYLYINKPVGVESNLQVFTDHNGENRTFRRPETRPNGCSEGKWVEVPNPAYRQGETPNLSPTVWIFEPASGANLFECGSVAYSHLKIVDTPATNPLPTVFIARNYQFGDSSRDSTAYELWFSPYGTREGLQGANLHLSDGRECSITVPYMAAHHSIAPPFKLDRDSFWHVKIAVDFEGTAIDPSRCTDGYTIQLNVRSVTAERVQGPM